MLSGPLLAISRTEANKITILGLDGSEHELGTIAVRSKQPFGLAFDEPRSRLYAACWGDGKILSVSLTSMQEESSFPVSRLPAWATRREGTNEIWFSNEGAGVVTILDTWNQTTSAPIATGNGPSDIAFTDDGLRAWVTNEKDKRVSIVDTQARRKVRDVRVGKVPQGLAAADEGRRLLVANFGSNTVSVLDVANSKELTQIAVGRGPVDIVTVAQPALERAWVTCFSEGAISIVDLQQGKETQRLPLGGKPQGIEVHPDRQRVYVAVRELNEIAVLGTDTPSSILRRIKMDGGPARMVIAP